MWYTHTYIGILFNHNKEENPAIYNNMGGLEGIMLIKMSDIER